MSTVWSPQITADFRKIFGGLEPAGYRYSPHDFVKNAYLRAKAMAAATLRCGIRI